MNFKLQLVAYQSDGDEPFLEDVFTWSREDLSLASVGLTLAESKELLQVIQQKMIGQQVPGALAHPGQPARHRRRFGGQQQHGHRAVAQHGGRHAAVKQLAQKAARPGNEHQQVGPGVGQSP